MYSCRPIGFARRCGRLRIACDCLTLRRFQDGQTRFWSLSADFSKRRLRALDPRHLACAATGDGRGRRRRRVRGHRAGRPMLTPAAAAARRLSTLCFARDCCRLAWSVSVRPSTWRACTDRSRHRCRVARSCPRQRHAQLARRPNSDRRQQPGRADLSGSASSTVSEVCMLAISASHRRRIDFTLCNPPFYSSAAEIDALAAEKDHSPLAVRSASPSTG